MRAHTPNGATRTATLEEDATELQAQLQEASRDLGLAVVVEPGEDPPSIEDVKKAAEAAPGVLAAAEEAKLAAEEAKGATENKLDKELPPTSPEVFDGGYSANVILDKPHVPDRFGATQAMLDGMADATAVIQRMLDASQDSAKDKLKPLELGAGRFRMDGRVTIDLGNYEGSLLRITGVGNNGTKIVLDRLNRDGAIKINRPHNMEHVHVSDLAFCSVLPQDDFVFPGQPYDALDNNGTALWITTGITPGSPGWGVQDDRSVRIERVHLHGVGPDSGEAHFVGVWGEAGVRIDFAWFPIIRDCAWRGVYQPDFDSANANNNRHCLLLNHCYAPEIETNLFNGYWGTGAANIGHEPNGTPGERFPWRWEGGRVRHNIFGGLLTDAMVFSHNFEPGTTLMAPGFQILDNHINARRFGVVMNGHRQVEITGNEFYTQHVAWPGEVLPASVHLSDCGDIDSANNLFGEPGRYQTDDNAFCAYRLENEVTGFKSVGDRFNHGGIGVRVGAGQTSRTIQVMDAVVTGKRVDALWAPFKRVVDKSGKAAVFWEEAEQGLWDQKRFRSHTADLNNSPVVAIERVRDDFGSVTNPKLGALSFRGLNSAGTLLDAAWIEGVMERNTAGNEATGVVLGGYVNGLFGSFLGVSGSSGQMFVNVGQVIHSSANSNNVFARPRYELFRARTDYATKPDAKLAEYAFAGLDSSGEKVVSSLIEGSFNTNLAGLATSIMRFINLENGAVVQPLALEGGHAIIEELWTGSVEITPGLSVIGRVILHDTFGNAYGVAVVPVS
ncbi:hypothetical protein NI454_09225 [Brevundimonas diminuta]|uniref:hypothetical protein n=1 Tax=Brevundimonas diminuta TaxID=293 RepID=UPI0020981E35|nr:hypothetical protein [Brevundimonas diminuta]MCO8030132.1 hypothetical protein [Brevundimonas diminuta]